MSPRRLIFILIALIASGATIFIGQAWLNAQRVTVAEAPAPQAPAPKPTRMVLVAGSPLTAGQFVRPENLRWQPWPDTDVPKTYMLSDQHQIEEFVGSVVRSSLGEGEPITESRVVRPGDRGFLAAVLTPGFRAVTVALTPQAGNAGFVFPGDHVDLLVTMTLSDDDDKSTDTRKQKEHHATETVLTDVRVLATDQRIDDDKKEVVIAKTATIEVTPKQAEIVGVVSEIGRLSMSLRSIAHDETQSVSESANGKLTYTFDSDATQLIAPPHFSGSTVRVSVLRADKETQMNFPRSER
ncbi:MAG TPA: Flp pilus assembly protein CpaB [Stellaceae bacterium]|nr:Flp pilus assembly protein CpaB [Stellaceae bacterium]